MDIQHFRSLSRKWAPKLRENAQDVEQEIVVFYLTRQSENRAMDVFQPGHEGALFELLKHKIRGNNLESLGGSGKSFGGADDEDDEGKSDIEDDIESPDEVVDQLEKRLQFEQVFCQELDQIDQLNNLAGNDLGDAFGFTGANGRAVLSQLKKQLVASAQKRFNASQRAAKQSSPAKARRQMATA
jgi:hypothetical protein